MRRRPRALFLRTRRLSSPMTNFARCGRSAAARRDPRGHRPRRSRFGGYYLLGLVIERDSGISYAQFLTRHIFAPLQMHHTGYDVNHPAPPGHAVGYVHGSRPARYIDMSVPFAAGALDSTTSDLARWNTALLTGRPALLRRSTLQQMFSPSASISPGHPDAGAYGYGWFIDLRGAEYDHDGLINGFATYNSIFPRRQIAIIVLSNLQSSDGRTIDDHLAALLGQQAR